MDKLKVGDTIIAYKANEQTAEYTVGAASPKGDRVQDIRYKPPIVFLSQIHGGGRVKRLFIPREEMEWEYFVEQAS